MNEENKSQEAVEPTDGVDELAQLEAEIEAANSSEEASAEGETAPTDSAPDKTKTPDSKSEDKPEGSAPDGGDEDELTDEELSHLSEKAQKRYRKLAAENKALRQQNGEPKNKSYWKRQSEVVEKPKTGPKNPKDPISGKLPWEEADDEIEYDPETGQPKPKVLTEEEIENSQRKIAAEEAGKVRDNIKNEQEVRQLAEQATKDVAEVESKYPELNPDAKEYNQELVDFIEHHFSLTIKKDRSARLLEYVDNVMKIYRTGETKGGENVDTTIKSQGAEQAISPSGDVPNNPSITLDQAKGMSLDKLEKMLPKAD